MTVDGYERTDATEVWDANWLTCTISGVIGRFEFGQINATLQTTDLVGFAGGVEELHKSLTGEARLATVEEWVGLVIVGDGSGRLEVSGHIRDKLGDPTNILSFNIFGYDQTFLPTLLTDVRESAARFPFVDS